MGLPTDDQLLLIQNRLRLDNPWWHSAQIRSDYEAMPRRYALDSFYALLRDTTLRRSVLLTGPRRVGKTVLIHHAISRLLAEGVPPNRILYLSVDTPIYNNLALEFLFDCARKTVGVEEQEGCYVFFDEIQYLRDWERHLKTLTDTYVGCRFAASGSAASDLHRKGLESGAGRFTEHTLAPLTFCEFLRLSKQDTLIQPDRFAWSADMPEVSCHATSDLNALNGAFLEYINFGGYPETVFSPSIRTDPGRFARSDIIDKVLLRDLPGLYGVTDVRELHAFFAYLVYHSGCEMSYETLSKASGVSKETLRRYLTYLEAAYLIRVVHKVDQTARRFHRVTAFKVYLTNPSLYSAFFQPLTATDPMLGNLVETAVMAQFFPRQNFDFGYANWRNGRQSQGEVDLVALDPHAQRPLWCTEIKWTDEPYANHSLLRPLLGFMETNRLGQAIVTSINVSGLVAKRAATLRYIPTALYAYTVGWNTLCGDDLGIGM